MNFLLGLADDHAWLYHQWPSQTRRTTTRLRHSVGNVSAATFNDPLLVPWSSVPTWMADSREAVRKLVRALQAAHYPHELPLPELKAGEPTAYLTLLQYLLSGYSRHVTAAFTSPTYRFATHALDDAYADNVLRAVNAVLGFRGRLTTKQFMAFGFSDHKMAFVTRVAALCSEMHEAREAELRRSVLRVIPHTPPTLDTPTLLKRRYETTTWRPASAAPPGRKPHSAVAQMDEVTSPMQVRSSYFILSCAGTAGAVAVVQTCHRRRRV